MKLWLLILFLLKKKQLALSSNKIKGNVNECRIVLVKNLIKESFYGKRKKSN